MSRNPFAQSGAVNPYDLPMTEQQRKAQPAGTGSAGPNVLTYDPVSKTGSPNVNVLLDEIFQQVRKHMDARDQQIIDTCAAEFAPILKRLNALEAAIDVQREDVANAIRTAAAGFLGEDDDSPTMEQLTRQHKEHMKTMEARRNDS